MAKESDDQKNSFPSALPHRQAKRSGKQSQKACQGLGQRITYFTFAGGIFAVASTI